MTAEPQWLLLINACGLWKWSSGSGITASRCRSALLRQPGIALRGSSSGWPSSLTPPQPSLSHGCWAERGRKILPLSKQDHSFSWALNRAGTLDAAVRELAELHQLHRVALPPQMAGTTNCGAQTSGKPCKLCVRRPLHSSRADLVSARSRFLSFVSHWFQDSADSGLPWHLSAVRSNYFWLPAPETVSCWAWSHIPSPRLLIPAALYNAG